MKKLFSVLMLLCCMLCANAKDVLNPLPNAEAVVEQGYMRFTVLTPQMIRIQYSRNKLFEERATFAVLNRNLPVPEFTVDDDGTNIIIKTSALELTYKKNATPRANTLQIKMQVNGQDVIWYYGKEDNSNLLGTMRTLDNVIGDTQRENLEKGIVSREGWAIIDESPSAKRGDGSTTFALEPNEDGFPWAAPLVDTASNTTDYYFMGYGHDYKKAMGDFVKIAGRIPLPPKYMFGYWYSRYWAYTQSEFQQLVRDMENNDIPVDVMIMDMDWHKSGWTGWSWNKNLISNPTGLLRYFHNHNLHVSLNLHPADGIADYEDYYSNIKNDVGITDNQNRVPWLIDRYDFYKSMFKNIIRAREKEGVDFWWLDWQQERTIGEHRRAHGLSTPTNGLDNLGETFWNNHVFWHDMQSQRPDRRTTIYHRWGGLGSHRYQIGFSGDTHTTWGTLAYQPEFTSTASNVGYGYWGHDLGGHQGGLFNDPELYLRWMQFGVFTPIFRTHATNDGRIERRIWMFENFDKLRETVVLRYALFPYIYTAARQAYDTGICINRPLYYDYPEENNAYIYKNEYMFGDNILVAPVVSPAGSDGLAVRPTWLPEGTWWDMAKNRLVNGGVTFSEKYNDSEIPYYLKAGSVIVNYPYQRTVMTTPETIILQVAPGGNGTGEFYEDNGDNNEYQDDVCTRTVFTQRGTATQAHLTIGGRKGSFEGMATTRTWKVQFLGARGEATKVTINGKNADTEAYSYDAEKGIVSVTVAATDLAQDINIIVEAPFCEPQTISGSSMPAVTPEVTNAQAWIVGTAVPGGIQPLEVYPNNENKYHGTLLPGTFHIINTEGIQDGTKFYASNTANVSMLGYDIPCSAKTTAEGTDWTVVSKADNYRLTFNMVTRKLTGEMVIPYVEMYIGGGCTAPGQGDKWHTEDFLEMTQDPANPYVWKWEGILSRYKGNDQPDAFKIMAQRDWSGHGLNPYVHGEKAEESTQLMNTTYNDNKWLITRDGRYSITLDSFRETFSAVYLDAGDVNGDGDVSVADLTLMASYILGNKSANINTTNADVNGDGDITVSDLTKLAGIILSGKNK